MNGNLANLFRSTYDTSEWFVCFRAAVKGLSHEQAKQKLTAQGDSVFGIVAHLTYWNERYLKKMKGEPQSGEMITDNEKTFLENGNEEWSALLQKAEKVFEGWVQHLRTLTPLDTEHDAAIGNTALHNAYHIGQIVMLRKLQGSWNKDEGVK